MERISTTTRNHLLAYVLLDSYVRKARLLIAKNATKSIVGREWLSLLQYEFAPQIDKGGRIVISIEKWEPSKETKNYIKGLQEMFSRNRQLAIDKIKTELKMAQRYRNRKREEL